MSGNAHLLGDKGKALDLACGRGGNAIFLAKSGYEVDAIDFSPVVLNELMLFSKKNNLSIETILRDVEKKGLLKTTKYDVIVVSYFLNRSLFPSLIEALAPKGLLFYQTWSQLSVSQAGPNNVAFRLKEGELLQLTESLQPVFYQENGLVGDTTKGLRNESMIVAQKRAYTSARSC